MCFLHSFIFCGIFLDKEIFFCYSDGKQTKGGICMYHLLVADDSEAELECIIFLISKFKLPFEITSALNGEEAFNYLINDYLLK